MTRRELRELLMQWVFQAEANKDFELLEDRFDYTKIKTDDNRDYARCVLSSISKNIEEIDQKIQSASKQWSIDRINRVDLAILRVACSEHIYCSIGTEIVINEAMELSKIYSTEKSYSYINGVLGEIFNEST